MLTLQTAVGGVPGSNPGSGKDVYVQKQYNFT